MAATTERLGLEISPVLAEWIDAGGLPWESRDARLERHANGLTTIELDDAGDGPYTRVVSDREADQLAAAGLLRDAR